MKEQEFNSALKVCLNTKPNHKKYNMEDKYLNRWISIDELLPEDGKLVICWHSAQLIPFVGFLSNIGWNPVFTHCYNTEMVTNKLVKGKITHWMYIQPIKP